jgi:hypothetical protein
MYVCVYVYMYAQIHVCILSPFSYETYHFLESWLLLSLCSCFVAAKYTSLDYSEYNSELRVLTVAKDFDI